MATQDDLHNVLLSIDDKMKEQTKALTSFVQAQAEAAKDAKRAANLSTGSASVAGRSKAGGFIAGTGAGIGATAGGIGGLLGGLGKGVGFAGIGIGAALLGLSTVLDQLPDGEDIKKNVETLLSIGEGYENRVEFFKEGGTLAVILGGLGLGLAAFGIGTTIVGISEAVNKFADNGNWASQIKSNVKELLSITSLEGADGKNVAGLTVTLGALGAALAAFGLGQGVAGVAGAITKFSGQEAWATNIKDNVKTLLEIPDLDNATLGNIASFPLTMASLGAGLIAFSAGQVTAGLASLPTVATDALDKFAGTSEGGDWATKVKDNVSTLLDIPDLPNATLGNLASFPLIMASLGAGLIAFSAGQAAVGLSSIPTVATDAIAKFTGTSEGGDWATKVKNNVETLLSIPSLPNANLGNNLAFVGTMSAIGAGLLAFAYGKGAEGIATAVNEGVTFFTTKDNLDFADRIKSEVTTLLEIPQLPGAGADTVKFIAVMGGIAAGLVAFSAGKLVEGGATAVQGALDFFTGQEEGFATRVKTEVTTLLSITDGRTDDGSTFNTAMGNIASGLLKFSAGEFGASFVGIGTNILNFLSGGESPIEKVMSIADKADDLTKGADALGSIAENLAKFKAIDFDGRKFNIEKFAEDLKDAVPIIEGALMGQEAGLIFGSKIYGLGSAEIQPSYEQAAVNIGILREALGMGGPARTQALSAATANLTEAQASGNANIVAPNSTNDNRTYNSNYYTTTPGSPSTDPAFNQ